MENITTLYIKQVPPEISDIRHFYEYDSLKVTNRDEFETASTYFLQVKSHLKTAETERKKITDPINAALKNTNAFFKRFTDPLEKIKDNLTRKMTVFADNERSKLIEIERLKLAEAKQIAEANALAAKKEAVETGSETAMEMAQNWSKQAAKIDLDEVKVSQTVRAGSIGTMAERRIWTFKIVDPTLVPREFLVVDEKKLRGFAKPYGESNTTIPGIEFFQETSFSATTR